MDHLLQLRDAALHYADALGWPVLPLHSVRNGVCTCRRGVNCGSPGKHPHTRNGIKAATTDVRTIRQWWSRWPNANVAIAAGLADLFVIDVDPAHDGRVSMNAAVKRLGKLPPHPKVRTGGGGWHLFFKHPGGPVPSRQRAWPRGSMCGVMAANQSRPHSQSRKPPKGFRVSSGIFCSSSPIEPLAVWVPEFGASRGGSVGSTTRHDHPPPRGRAPSADWKLAVWSDGGTPCRETDGQEPPTPEEFAQARARAGGRLSLKDLDPPAKTMLTVCD